MGSIPLPTAIFILALLHCFFNAAKTSIHTNSVNRVPKTNLVEGYSTVCLGYKGDLGKNTGTGHKIDVCTQRRSAHILRNMSFGTPIAG